jgi:hypothetical protein
VAYFNQPEVPVASEGDYKVIYTKMCVKTTTRLEGMIGKNVEEGSVIA